MEYLAGGRVGKIARVDETIIRPAGEWTPTVHRLLKHVREEGFLAVPKPLGFDDAGNEIVSLLSGEVSNYPLSEAAASEEALVSAATLLRAFHDASTIFISKLTGHEDWMLPPREPTEVICHGDYAPYNVVLQGNKAVGIIDFDTAHPAPRVWDIAYALYRWAPLTHPNNPDGFGSQQEKTKRAQLFCDTYDLSAASREGLIQLVIERLQALVNYMQAEADSGNEAFKANIAEGHHLTYFRDIEFLKADGMAIQQAISNHSI